MKKHTRKARQKERNIPEFFKAQIRELESENRSLKKEIKRLQRQEHFNETKEETVAEEKEYKEKCKVCGKGFLEEFIAISRLFKRCPLCGFRSIGTKI